MTRIARTTSTAAAVEVPPAPLLKTCDVADQLAMSREQVWRLWSCGKLPGYKLDRHLRFTQTDVNSFLAQAYSGQPKTTRTPAPAPKLRGEGPYRPI